MWNSRALRLIRAIWVLLLIETIAEGARGLILPFLSGFAIFVGGDKDSSGVAVAVFSAGRFVSGLTCGYVSNYVPFRYVLAVALGLGAIGNLLNFIAAARGELRSVC